MSIINKTEYFEKKVMNKRPYLKEEWIEFVIQNYESKEMKIENNRVRFWAYIKELGKYLRVVTLKNEITVHNAFPDKTYTGRKIK